MIPKRIERLPWREVDGRAVVLDPRSGQVHELNLVGTFLWQNTDGKTSLESLSTLVLENFEVDPAEASSDVQDFFSTLASHGLVHWATSETA